MDLPAHCCLLEKPSLQSWMCQGASACKWKSPFTLVLVSKGGSSIKRKKRERKKSSSCSPALSLSDKNTRFHRYTRHCRTLLWDDQLIWHLELTLRGFPKVKVHKGLQDSILRRSFKWIYMNLETWTTLLICLSSRDLNTSLFLKGWQTSKGAAMDTG